MALFRCFRCDSCGYIYDEEKGHEREGYPPGTTWDTMPDDFLCPDCGVRAKPDFEEIAATTGLD